ncbi:glycoside hydrolase family 17 protein [Mycena alexandri]|uniref:glucan endo-1,3-beta-D-glucosidase n=1 Tax=Mycena alexandri TaxID=1745969 RepID=A0AAD6WLZ3_9AGAR|nr:glycoside hydrolase family 17 protein [Mycena alexandri]
MARWRVIPPSHLFPLSLPLIMVSYRTGPPPSRSQTDLQQYYDAPYDSDRDGGGGAQAIPMQQKYAYGYRAPAAADSQTNFGIGGGGRDPKIPRRNSAWLEKNILSLLALTVLVAAGVVVGVFVAQHKFSSSSSPSAASTSASSKNSNSPPDPSVFTKNPALVQSFYGIAYTPEGSQLPECGNSLDDIITDIQLLSQLTTRIRLYGADCNQTELVLEAIKQTQVNLTIWVGNYAIATDGGTAYTRQRDAIGAAIKKYGVGSVGGVTVGNEFVLDYLDAHDAIDPNGAVGNAGAAILIEDIRDTRAVMSGLGLGNVSIGTSDAGSYFNTEVLEAVDHGMANVHPWFANTRIEDAARWTADFFASTDLAAAAALSNAPQMYIAETGWPTNSSTAAASSNGAAAASEANLQIFLDTFVCQANANGTKYFFFEYFDEEWKNIQYGGVEGYWGLFYQNRTLKGVTIPTCD